MERDYVGVSLFCNNYFLIGDQRCDENILNLDLEALAHPHDKEAIAGEVSRWYIEGFWPL